MKWVVSKGGFHIPSTIRVYLEREVGFFDCPDVCRLSFILWCALYIIYTRVILIIYHTIVICNTACDLRYLLLLYGPKCFKIYEMAEASFLTFAKLSV